jgi:hypothetical protein
VERKAVQPARTTPGRPTVGDAEGKGAELYAYVAGNAGETELVRLIQNDVWST